MCSDCFQNTPFIRPRLLIQLTTSFTIFAVLNPFFNIFYKNFKKKKKFEDKIDTYLTIGLTVSVILNVTFFQNIQHLFCVKQNDLLKSISVKEYELKIVVQYEKFWKSDKSCSSSL